MTTPDHDRATITVLGAGYVGLAAAACLADLGHYVRCIDINPEHIELLADGRFASSEIGLTELILKGAAKGLLSFETPTPHSDVSDADFVFVCLPTPASADGSADLSLVFAALHQRRSAFKPAAIVVLKSTMPPNSNRECAQRLDRADVHIVSNPEFLREGRTVYDFMNPDRIVVGSDDLDSGSRVVDLYVGLPGERIVTDSVTAELIKYASNAYLAMRLSFVNSLANLSTALGSNTNELLRGVGSDRRIGDDYLRPGPGWGGSCLPKDTRALLHVAESRGVAFDLVRTAIDQNTNQMRDVVDRVLSMNDGTAEGMVVAIWGLAFKSGTADVRDSPSLVIIDHLIRHGAHIRVNDPHITDVSPEIANIECMYEVCRDADALLVLTDSDEYRAADLHEVRSLLRNPVLIDTKHLFEAAQLREAGFWEVG